MVDYDVVDKIALHTVEVGDMLRIGGEDFSVEQVIDNGDTVTLELLDSSGEDDTFIGDADQNVELLGIATTEDD